MSPRSPADYERVYDRVLRQAREPVILHWLGDMFDPALKGYWGSADTHAAMDTALGIIEAHASKVDGIKISLLDKDQEIAMRRRLPAGVRMYTGDDFNYAELIAGDGVGTHPRIATATRCSASSTPSRRRRVRRWPRWRRATKRASTPSWRRPCRCRATSSVRRRATTRPASSSWPGSTATRTTS